MTDEELVREVEAQRELLIAVATGGPRLDDVNPEYRERRARIARDLQVRRIEDPNPYSDLWRWHAYWSTQLPGYASRRWYIAELYDPLLDRLRGARSVQAFDAATGWERVDRVVENARSDLRAAVDEEEYQAVGLQCREILISVAQAVHNYDEHPTSDGTVPSETDAKRRLDAYVLATLSGGGAAEARAVAKAAVALALAVQHRRTATFRDAALCLEATCAVVNIVAVLDGQRDLEPHAR